jgi:hypothetical protein
MDLITFFEWVGVEQSDGEGVVKSCIAWLRWTTMARPQLD